MLTRGGFANGEAGTFGHKMRKRIQTIIFLIVGIGLSILAVSQSTTALLNGEISLKGRGAPARTFTRATDPSGYWTHTGITMAAGLFAISWTCAVIYMAVKDRNKGPNTPSDRTR